MAETVLKFEGSVTGQFELERSLAYAPKVLAKYFARGLGKERSLFVGNPKKKNALGSFNRPLSKRQLWGGRINKWGQDTWSNQMTRGFRGKIYGGNPLQGMTLEVGVSPRNKMKDILERMHHAHSQMGGGKYMVIPMYSNLKNLGMDRVTVGSKIHMAKVFSEWGLKRKVFVIKRGNTILWYDRELYAKDPMSALLFYGVKGTYVKKQFDSIEKQWKPREPKAIGRLAGAIDKGVAAINRGEFE